MILLEMSTNMDINLKIIYNDTADDINIHGTM